MVSEYDYSRFFKWLLFKACDSSCISHSQLKGKELRSRKKDVDDRIFKVKQTHNNNLWNAINGYPGANSGGRGVDGMVNSLINSWTCQRGYRRTIRFSVTTLWFCRNITKQWNNNFWKIVIIITGISQLIIYFLPFFLPFLSSARCCWWHNNSEVRLHHMGGRKRQANDQRKNKYAQGNNRKGIPCILRNKNNTDITNSTRVLPVFRMFKFTSRW